MKDQLQTSEEQGRNAKFSKLPIVPTLGEEENKCRKFSDLVLPCNKVLYYVYKNYSQIDKKLSTVILFYRDNLSGL